MKRRARNKFNHSLKSHIFSVLISCRMGLAWYLAGSERKPKTDHKNPACLDKFNTCLNPACLNSMCLNSMCLNSMCLNSMCLNSMCLNLMCLNFLCLNPCLNFKMLPKMSIFVIVMQNLEPLTVRVFAARKLDKKRDLNTRGLKRYFRRAASDYTSTQSVKVVQPFRF